VAGGGERAAAEDGALADQPVTEAVATPVSDTPSGRVAAYHAPVAFTTLKWVSLFHSCVYLCLLLCAFALGNPQPETFVLGLSHGLLWIFMSVVCLAAVRARLVPLRLAVAVAVLGGIGPFFGSYEFLREQRRRECRQTHTTVRS
jgi:hypothetical protein